MIRITPTRNLIISPLGVGFLIIGKLRHRQETRLHLRYGMLAVNWSQTSRVIRKRYGTEWMQNDSQFCLVMADC